MNEIIICNNTMPMLSGCGFVAASEPFRHADRTADFNVLIYVSEGEIPVTEGDIDFTIGEGELLFLKSGIHHYGKRDVPKGTKWFFAHFNNTEQALPSFIPNSGALPQYQQSLYSLSLPKYLTGLKGSDTEREITAFAEYAAGDDRFKAWYINQRFFMLLSRIAMGELTQSTRPTLSDKIAAYLAENRDKPFSAKDLSAELYLSYNRLAAVFKAEKGVTMQQYHQSVKMEEACRLLRSTLLSVGEIAAMLGYSDMLYFSRCFHSALGCSPTEYRRRSAKI